MAQQGLETAIFRLAVVLHQGGDHGAAGQLLAKHFAWSEGSTNELSSTLWAHLQASIII